MHIKSSKGGSVVINYIQPCLCSYITFISFLIIILSLFTTAITKCWRKSFRKSGDSENNFLGKLLQAFFRIWRKNSWAFDDFLIKSPGKSICLYYLIMKVLMANMTIRNQVIDYLAALKRRVCFLQPPFYLHEQYHHGPFS